MKVGIDSEQKSIEVRNDLGCDLEGEKEDNEEKLS